MKKIRLANSHRLARILETFDLESFQPFAPGQQVLPGMEGREKELKALDILKQLSPLEEEFWELWDENINERSFNDIELSDDWFDGSGIEDEIGNYIEAFSDDPDFTEKVLRDMGLDKKAELFSKFLEEKEIEAEKFMSFVSSSDVKDIVQNIIIVRSSAATFFAQYVQRHSDPKKLQEFMEEFTPRSQDEFYDTRRVFRDKEKLEDVQEVKQINENNKKILQNLVNKLQRGYISKEELAQFFSKFKLDKEGKEDIEEPTEEVASKGFASWFLNLDSKNRGYAASIILRGASLIDSFSKAFFAEFDFKDGIENVPEISGKLSEEFNEWIRDDFNIGDDVFADYIRENYQNEIMDSMHESEVDYIRSEMPEEINDLANGSEVNILGLVEVNEFIKSSRGEALSGHDDWSEHVMDVVDQMEEILSGIQDSEVTDAVNKFLGQT